MFAGYALAQQPFATSVGFYYTASTADTIRAVAQIAAQAAYTTQVQEFATGRDTVAATSVFLVTAPEIVVGFDRADTLHSFSTFTSDAARLSDSNAARITATVLANEIAAPLDAALPSVGMPAVAAEGAGALDAVGASADFAVLAVEAAVALDVLVCRFLWEPIDDSQSAGWTDVLPSVTISEIGTFAGSTFAGFPYAGTYSRTFSPYVTPWTPINNDQTPGWTQVNAPS